jgi:hypothetical protein
MSNPFNKLPTEALTFEQLPAAVSQIWNKLDAIEKLLHTSHEADPDPDRWFNLDELCIYLPDKPAKPTVYGWVHTAIIPNHKNGKKLRFLKSEIDIWLKSGRRKTISETADEASQYINRKRLQNEQQRTK